MASLFPLPSQALPARHALPAKLYLNAIILKFLCLSEANCLHSIFHLPTDPRDLIVVDS